MQFKSKGAMKWLEFDLLANCSEVKHAVFFKTGGTSEGPFASLNFEQAVGDHEDSVKQNKKKACEILQLQNLIGLKQCHGKTIQEIHGPSLQIQEGDALATCEKEIGLLIKHADCQAAIFYDPVNQAIANVHAGWRGNVQNIYAETVNMMKSRYHSKPQDLIVCIGPSLGPEHAEFVNYKTELPESFWQFQWKPNYFDLWAISFWQLTQCGVLSNHIEMARINTYLDPDCFSYRRDKVTGRHGTIVALKS